ncbi:MAG: hypothetical protein ACOC0P_02660, partial [Planctomycetota bacterium]
MKTYRVQLHLKSALATPLAADTLWGHIAWGIRYADGEDRLKSWLNTYDEAAARADAGSMSALEPPLVISDPLPAGWSPVPKLPPPPRPAELPSVNEVDAAKRMSRRKWLSH